MMYNRRTVAQNTIASLMILAASTPLGVYWMAETLSLLLRPRFPR